jgi:hypothetical protein
MFSRDNGHAGPTAVATAIAVAFIALALAIPAGAETADASDPPAAAPTSTPAAAEEAPPAVSEEVEEAAAGPERGCGTDGRTGSARRRGGANRGAG